MVEITGEYEGNLHCRATHGPSGGGLSTDAPKDNQGLGGAFSPTDLVATALVTCMATTMAIVARKNDVDLAGLRYRAMKDMSSAPPRRISRISIELWLPPAAKKLPAGTLEKAAEGCPVYLSLGPDVEKTVTYHWQ